MSDETTIAEASTKALLDLQATDARIRLDRFLDTLDAVHDTIPEESLRIIKSQAKRIEELEEENATLRATDELVERASNSGKMFRLMRLSINNNVSMWTAVIGTKTYPTLREALEALGKAG